MVLIVVLVVIALLSLAALTFAELMLAERQAADLSVRQAQARAAAESGIEMARIFLAQDPQSQLDAGACYDNPALFRAVVVNPEQLGGGEGQAYAAGAARHRSRFTLIAPGMQEGSFAGVRFGLEDESARLNLNALMFVDQGAAGITPNAARQILMGLPMMTEDTADAILDFMDEDEEPREFGAEADIYSMLDPPCAPKNGPLDSIEELLVVPGVTPALLFGLDVNHDGVIDPGEFEQGLPPEVDPGDGSMDYGWAAYLTLCSLEANVRPDGQPRIYVMQEDLQKLYDELVEALGDEVGKEWGTYIVAYRQFGPMAPNAKPQPNTPRVRTVAIDFEQKANPKVIVSTILDLIGSQVQVTSQDKNKKPSSVVLETPFPKEPLLMAGYLTKMADYLTANSAPVIPGRININQASRIVLSGVPGMTPEILDQILSERVPNPAQADPSRRYETWLLAEGIVTLEQMKKMIPFITGGGSVYRVQSVGYFDEAGGHARVEAVLNATTRPPSVVFWRDMSHLGRGYSLETLGVGLLGE